MTDGIHKLPAEALAACFAFLEFDDLISVSHVSRFWRLSSLSSPSLWTDISLIGPYGRPANRLHMAMSRAGQLAVEFNYFQFQGHAPESMTGAVAQYMHQFQRFKWRADPSNLDITRPAPLLRVFTIYQTRLCIIPRNFLGGVAGNLRTLHLGAASFADACPALETVTHLTVSYPRHLRLTDQSPRFDRLFDLFPRLEALHLRYLSGSPGAELPRGVAPRTLRVVKLDSWTADLLDLFTVWGLDSIADVQLEIRPIILFKIPAFISGAEELSVLLNGGGYGIRIVARLSGARQRRLICNNLDDPVSTLVDLLQDPAALSHVKVLELPVSVLTRALASSYHWPRLARLTVHVWRHDNDTREAHPLPEEEYDQPPPWSTLECLRSVPAVEALALHVHPSSGWLVPSLEDVCELVECLSALCGCLPRELLIYGVTAFVSHQLALRDDLRHRLVFIDFIPT